MVTGKDLIAWGYTPGKWFGDALRHANTLVGHYDEEFIRKQIDMFVPPPPVHLPLQDRNKIPLGINLPTDDVGYHQVYDRMWNLMGVPVVKAGAIMPDACEAGIIPVGGVVASSEIHPGFHSADICCSVALSDLGRVDPKAVLDKAMEVTHFGPGGRPADQTIYPGYDVLLGFDGNPFLKDMVSTVAQEHFATQGDGNHFLYVGTMKSTGNTVVVTHHGSRKPGAMLYKRGQALAEKYRMELSPETPKGAGWIPADSDDGRAYWDALQAIRLWTQASHYAIHDLIGMKVHDRLWNEHNFVFQKPDGLFYHAKGATPGWGLGLVPLNMAAPILVTYGKKATDQNLGFLPHGAGRYWSRTEFLRNHDEYVTLMGAHGIDVRFFSGTPDFSEFPSAYKPAKLVKAGMDYFNLAHIVDEIEPYGSIMAGDWKANYR